MEEVWQDGLLNIVLFFLRTLGERGGDAGDVVYAVTPIDGGGKIRSTCFARSHRDSRRPTSGAKCYTRIDRRCLCARCQVQRSQFRHSNRIDMASARWLYPGRDLSGTIGCSPV